MVSHIFTLLILSTNSINSEIGDIYINRVKNNPITFILGSDGKPTFKSSKTSIWPVCNFQLIFSETKELSKDIS